MTNVCSHPSKIPNSFTVISRPALKHGTQKLIPSRLTNWPPIELASPDTQGCSPQTGDRELGGHCHLNYTLDFQREKAALRKEGVKVEGSLCDLMFA